MSPLAEAMRDMLRDVVRDVLREELPRVTASPVSTEERWLSVATAAKLCEVGQNTVYGWIADGLKATRRGRTYRIRMAHLIEWMEGAGELSTEEIDRRVSEIIGG